MSNDAPPALRDWIAKTLGADSFVLHPLVPEASTRRFYRLEPHHGQSRMAIHAPPATENNEQFVVMARVFRRHRVPVPQIHAYNLEQGYFLVDDFGSRELLAVYQNSELRGYAIGLALEALVAIQRTQDTHVPPYTRQRLRDELNIFEEWCCGKMLGESAKPLGNIADTLTREIDRQPKVTVHRDYHSRNLLLHGDRLGIVDFQDALVGSSVYDLASLMYDCYFEHSHEEIETWIDQFRLLVAKADLPCIQPRAAFIRALELAAIQRMLKAVGIFCRLWFSQHKTTHLPYILPVLGRITTLAQRNELSPLSLWLDSHVIPNLHDSLQRITS
ncbi:MAG: phosphotransferase [Gammaproteobacteria bacterium]|nr:phosphotransferase [Gammaproteobacteria bacterium]